MKKGNLFVISGPSGVGKDTIIEELLKEDENIWLSISMTTREKRDHEEVDVMSGTDAGNTPAVAWGALLRTDNDNTSAPIADGKTMKQEAQGTRPSAWGGHYVCTITRIGGTITVVTEYTATKATDVTFTNTVIMTGMTTAELDVRISGNPAPLSNFEAWSGTLSAAN